MVQVFRQVLSLAVVASFGIVPSAPVLAQPADWLLVENPTTCGAGGPGGVLIGTPDGVRYGFIVQDITVGDRAAREIKVDGKPFTLRFAQANTSAFADLPPEVLAALANSQRLTLSWPDKTVDLPTASLSTVLGQLKTCGASRQATRVSTPSAAPAAPGGPLKLRLVCSGTQVVTETERTSIDISKDFDVTDSASGSATTSRAARVPRRVQVVIDGDTARVRLPAAMIPTLASRPPDGWFTWTEFAADDEKITGRYSINFINKPKVRIDRRTGDIEMGGLAPFSGTCEPDTTDARRF